MRATSGGAIERESGRGEERAALVAKWREKLKLLEPPEGEVTATSAIRLPFIDEEPSGDLGAVDLSTVPKSQKPRLEAILFNRAVEERDPKRRLDLLTLFAKQFPSSAHMGKVGYLFFVTHRERQDHPKALLQPKPILNETRRVRTSCSIPRRRTSSSNVSPRKFCLIRSWFLL